MVLLLCSLLFGFGRALTAFVNTLSLSRSAMAGILLTSLCLLMFSFSSTVAWLLCLRLALGLLSGYLGYFFELDRAAGLSRSAWVVAAGLSAFVASALYASVSHEAQLLPLHPASASFLCSHPVFASFFALATGVLVFFVLYVFSEKFGFIDDDDEQQRVASAFSEPVSLDSACVLRNFAQFMSVGDDDNVDVDVLPAVCRGFNHRCQTFLVGVLSSPRQDR